MAKKRGFTLVELLVVVAIIALLMAMLMPALRQAQRQAKAVMCQANLKQWALIFAMYTNDYEGNFMEGWAGAPSRLPDTRSNRWFIGESGDEYKYKWCLDGYIGTDEAEELRLCPMATKSGELSGEHEFVRARYTAWGSEYFKGSYGINGWVHNPEPGCHIHDGPTERPTEWNWRNANSRGANYVPMFFDCRFPCTWPDDWNMPPETDCVPPGETGLPGAGEMGRVCIDRHNGYINGAFLDFSVRRIGLKELWKLKWHRNFNTNGPYTTAGGMLPEDWPDWMRNFRDYE